MKKTLLSILALTLSLNADYFYSYNKKINLTKLADTPPLKQKNNHQSPISYYKNSSGQKIGIDNKIIVSFKDLRVKNYIEKEFDLEEIRSITKDMFVYRIKDSSKTLEIANQLNQSSGIEFSHPDFVIEKKTRATDDPYYWQSWHLDRINAEKAWHLGGTGRGIVVGVYDEGIDLEHEDLRRNIIGFGNYADGLKQLTMIHSYSQLDNSDINAPRSISSKWHGTACSGLIAAVGNNNLGGVGIAPEAKLIVARYSSTNISDDSQALIDMANNGAAIITNSWGTNNMLPSFEKTLKLLSEEGRDGKGVLVFFAAGNDGCNMDKFYQVGNDGRIECSNNPSDNPINDESESKYVISIASMTGDNSIASYSNYGSAIDFVTPGGYPGKSIVTTDAMGEKGFGPYNYTPMSGGFNGTSASSPMAAAIAALVLSVNPTLSKEEVIDIFKATAKKYGGYPYDMNGRNDHWGYGKIEAGDSVELAANYGKIKTINFAKTIYSDLHR